MPDATPDEQLEAPVPDPVYAGRTPTGHHEWRGAAEPGDGTTARFVLYGGGEVRPAWQGMGGDVIATREFRLANYRRDPVVLADHDPTQVIGRGTAEIVQTENGARLEGSVVWDLHESNPLAILIAGQHARKMRSAVSIGFMPGKGSVPRTKLAPDDAWYLDPEKVPSWQAGTYHRHPELYEWSSVAVPRDPTALQLQSWAAAAEDPDERITRVVREVLHREAGALVLQAVRSNLDVRRSIEAAALLAVPRPAPPTTPPPSALEAWWATRSA